MSHNWGAFIIVLNFPQLTNNPLFRGCRLKGGGGGETSCYVKSTSTLSYPNIFKINCGWRVVTPCIKYVSKTPAQIIVAEGSVVVDIS